MRSLGAALLVVAFAAPSLAQRDPNTALLARAGWEALAAGRPHDAADAFRRALDADPGNPELYLGAGTAAFVERRDSDARQALEHALALDPGQTEAAYVLGQVLHRLGDVQGAVRRYEDLAVRTRGSSLAPKVADALARWRREVTLAARMQKAVGAHFTVSFNGPEDQTLAGRALESLDRAYWRIGATLSTYPNDPIQVVLYTGEQFRDITRSPPWAAGAYDGTIRVPMRGALDDPQELDRVLAHEFCHALVRTLARRNVPAWLDEGLAAALESDDLGWAERTARAHGPPRLPALEGSFGGFTPAQAQLAYAVSAIAVQRLLDERGGFAIANLLRELGTGRDFEAAFAHCMQETFAQFQASLAE